MTNIQEEINKIHLNENLDNLNKEFLITFLSHWVAPKLKENDELKERLKIISENLDDLFICDLCKLPLIYEYVSCCDMCNKQICTYCDVHFADVCNMCHHEICMKCKTIHDCNKKT